jgi:hypothetical protein
MEYDVVQSWSLWALINAVRERIEQGWRPIGGINATPIELDKGNWFKYLQAIVRETGGLK